MYTSILIPTDGSVCSDKAIAHALKLAALCKAKVHFIYVAQSSYTVGMAEVDGFVGYAGQIDEDMSKMGEEALATATQLAEQAGISSTHQLCEGGAAASIISEAATACDLVVMGGHGRSGLVRVLLGSVSEAVIRQVSVPVLVVHCDDED